MNNTSESPAKAHGKILTRRWVEQRWLLDNIIRSVGVDWDQPRTISYNAPCGPEANADFAAIRARVKKYADIAPAFASTARRREAKAQAADEAGERVTARQNYFMAAIHWAAAGRAMMDWLAARPEIDPDRIGIIGSSFGSFFSTIVCANEPRFRACAVSATCLEPGCHTIFEEASPTFKQRFMYMSGYTDEDAFDEFRKTLTWEGHAEKIRVPYLCVAGEADELSPLEHTERLLKSLQCPKQLVVYQDCRHSVGNVPSTNLGPTPAVLVADWMNARLSGKPFRSERWYVEASGRVVKTAYSES